MIQPYHCWVCTPKEIISEKTSAKIFLAALFVVATNWKTRVCLSIGEWLNKLCYMLVLEYYCAQRSNALEKFHMKWKLPGSDAEGKEQIQENVIHCCTMEHNALLY